MENKAHQHLENQYCHEQQSVFSPFLLIKPSSAHIQCTFCYYWCILRFDIGLDSFSVTGFPWQAIIIWKQKKTTSYVGKMHQIWTNN